MISIDRQELKTMRNWDCNFYKFLPSEMMDFIRIHEGVFTLTLIKSNIGEVTLLKRDGNTVYKNMRTWKNKISRDKFPWLKGIEGKRGTFAYLLASNRSNSQKKWRDDRWMFLQRLNYRDQVYAVRNFMLEHGEKKVDDYRLLEDKSLHQSCYSPSLEIREVLK